MIEIVNYLCENHRKTEAKQFIRNNIAWFVKYVDPGDKGSDYYKTYNSQTSKAKLLKVVAEY